ncbi:HpsJ family protein [Crocosphaera sp. XPORK-15E]|uniref:hormogonium polysaccharide biosynthesis protein HpsJ n=1 Tax=Crocosphaera sp. XPORK-15E TaxID=3110247 RepID=UPI002B1F0E7D|nr:HpsJ family protein [Crocosphaera sp. XPORK-15E]MEA5535342.1 HpsJ family protein [Crocosphaera sp. XPORK-15E]
MNYPAFTSLALKLIGVIFILSSLLDYVTLAVPLQWESQQWQIGLVTSVVDRGVVPLVGIGFILVGYWIDSLADASPMKKSGFDLRFPIFILSAVLGLVFLLMVPLHLNNLNVAKTNALEQIQQGAGQGAQQIQNFLTQVDALSKNPQRLNGQLQQLNQAIETGQVQGQQLNAQQLEAARQQRDQLQGLRDLAKNPAEYKKRTDELKKQLETQLVTRRKQAEDQAKTQALKQSLRIGLSSLMLAIVYFVIGVFGLRISMSSPKMASRPKAPKR